MLGVLWKAYSGVRKPSCRLRDRKRVLGREFTILTGQHLFRILLSLIRQASHKAPLCHECHINGVERVGTVRKPRGFARGAFCAWTSRAAALYANSHSVRSRAHGEKAAEAISVAAK